MIKDVLGLPVYEDDYILGISGHERLKHRVKSISNVSIKTYDDKVYFKGNFLNINAIIEKHAEFFI